MQRRSLDFYRSKDRVSSTHHLVEKTGDSGWKVMRAVICGDAIFFPLLSLSSSCQDILYSGSFSHHVKFYSVMMHKISTRMVCVNGRQVAILKSEMRSTKANTNLLTLLEKASAKTASSK